MATHVDDKVAEIRETQAPPDRPSLLDELLTAKQVAHLLQVPASTVEDYARRRVLPSLKLGRHRRFVRSEVEQAVSEMAARRR